MDIQETYLFPYARKGLANNIPEEDVFGNVADNEALAKMRAVLTIHTQYKASAADEENQDKTVINDKEIGLYGPADVSSISPAAILKCRPAPGSDGFPPEYFPYIEFREPDFPWRYTPAKVKDNRLTPWLALVVLEKDLISVQNNDNKLPVVKFNGDKAAYQAAFPSMSELWKTAHAQSPKKTVPLFSRVISLRGIDPETGKIPALKPTTDYMVCLVPSYETGRLRGLGFAPEKLYGLTAQAPAFEDYDIQKGKQRGMEFPVYYSWNFRSGEASFEALVESLKVVKSGKAGLAVDVTHMGNGFDYEAVYKKGPGKKVRKTITIPAATKPQPPEPEEAAFPNKTDEKALYDNLKTLLESSYIFLENAADIGQEIPKGGPDEGDDPCVVPPVYGARHILATKLDQQPWMNKINMDVHYRIAAGLGRKAVLENQEMLMDRAWKQVEAVQALNMELYKRLLSMGANNALHGKTVGQYGKDNKYLASMMFYLSSMKDAYKEKGDPTLASVLEDRDVPRAFATPSFHGMTDRVAKIVADLDTKSVMENILEYQTYRFPDHEVYGTYPISSLRSYSDAAFTNISTGIFDAMILSHLKQSSTAQGADLTQQSYTVNVEKLADLNMSIHLETDGSIRYYAAGIENKYTIPNYDDVSICPSSPLVWLRLFIRKKSIDSGLSSAQLNEKDSENRDKQVELFVEEFFNKKYDCHNCYGFIYDFDKMLEGFDKGELKIKDGCTAEYFKYVLKRVDYNIGTRDNPVFEREVLSDSPSWTESLKPNLLVLRNGTYQSLFGSVPFTRFTITGNQIYIVDYETLMAIHKKQPGVVDLLYKVPGEEYLKVNYFTKPIIKSGEQEVALPYGGSYPKTLDHPVEYPGEMITLVDTSLVSSKIRHIITDYIQTPPAFKINLNQLPNSDIQEFKTIEDYFKFLKDRVDGSVLPYMEMWNNFNNLVLKLEKDYPKKKEESKLKVNNDSTEKIKDNLRNTTAYDDSIDILTNFYGTFFSNSETGAKLQGKYIDELLMSKYPILAYPIFPEPTYKYLKEFSEEFVIPGIGDIPMDSVSVFSTNPSFIESYLAGLNTEMGRELLWREYPTDQRGSYFRKFWDSEVSMKDIADDNFYDITPVHTWTGELGTNMKEGKDSLLIFAIKGRLMKLYPTTRVCLWPAKLVSKDNVDFDKNATFANGKILSPIMESFLNEDVLMVGFKIDAATALGNPANNEYGYFLTFIEDVEDLNFTMEEPDDLSHPDAGLIADALKNDPSFYGKHVSLFIK